MLKELWDELGIGEQERHQFWSQLLLMNPSSTATKMCQDEVLVPVFEEVNHFPR